MPFLFQLQFTAFSTFWILVSLLTGLSYAFLLYRKNKALSVSSTRLLFTLRALAVASITFLLFAPFTKFSTKRIEKPLIFFLQDNSASIAISQPSGFNLQRYNQDVQGLAKSFSDDFEFKTIRFGQTISDTLNNQYNEKLSDISSAFKYINERFSNRNIGSVILASDGIYNRGGTPLYEALNIKAPVYTIALGDTIPKKDLLISNVNYNNIVYQGNDFQVEINVEAYQSKGGISKLTVSDKSGVLINRPITIATNEFRLTLPITLPAKQKGVQRFTISLSPLDEELSKENNFQTFFVEVVDGKQKIFILANAPHPDITALKQSIESNKNYEVKTDFPGSYNSTDLANADLIILHQLPSIGNSNADLNKLIAGKNIWYILGSQSNTTLFSSMQNALSITSAGISQEATASVNPEFYDFTLSESSRAKIQNFAPLNTPFGNYGNKGQISVLLTQQIGKVGTNKPLLAFSKEGSNRSAVLVGEGIWRWRLEDFKENSNHQAVDELISKVVQYLSSKEDKRKFRVYPARNTFDESEHIILNGELYNDAYELVNTPDAAVTLKNNNNKSFPFLFSRTGNSYLLDAGILPPGEYSFIAKTKLGNTQHQANGQFVISQQQTEYRQTTANHQLLYNLAKQSGAQIIYPNQIGSLPNIIKENELVKTISYEDKRYEELVNLKWLFALILALLSIEWFIRKRNGEI